MDCAVLSAAGYSILKYVSAYGVLSTSVVFA